MAFARRAAETLGAILVVSLRAVRTLHLASFASIGQVLSLIPGYPGIFVRRAWYRSTLAACGSELTLEFGATMHDDQAEIGDHCFFGKHSLVGLAQIGDDFMCGDHAQILSGMRHHPFDRRDIPIRSQGEPVRERVHIGRDVWVGAGAIVGADIASHCVVAAGAVVVKRVEHDWSIVGGVPADQIGTRP
jgi:acetyltransferase-like isoleucine patch superfamily enzyme